MATITRFTFLRHMRAEPNQYVLHFKDGRLVREGKGLAYWFNPLSAAVAQLPVEDCEATFLLRERSADFQEVSVQVTLTYRVSDPSLAAARVNFSLALDTGVWKEQPLERLANLWSQRAQQPTRAYLVTVPVVEAARGGAEVICSAIDAALRTDSEIQAMGLALVSVRVSSVTPAADVEKALQTPTREGIQQKADEAVFQRRALAVEKERAIKENELATEIELARRQEQLIRQQGANKLLGIREEASGEQARIEAEIARKALLAASDAKDIVVRQEGQSQARRIYFEAENEGEAGRLAVYQGAPQKVVLGLALREFAQKLQTIQHLNITPDLLTQSLKHFFEEQAGQ
mgnify:CR=1 FL=1